MQNILVVPLRQLDLRAAVQPELRRPRADHRGRDARRGGRPRRLLRRRRARCATWCRTTCCSCSALIAMEPPVRARRGGGPRREGQGAARARSADAARRSRHRTVRGQYGVGRDRTARRARLPPGGRASIRTRRPRPTSRCASSSTTGAGRACRSFCARASGCAKRVTEIAVQFKRPPMPCSAARRRRDEVRASEPKPNLLVLRIQPDEGISLSFACKRPGMQCSSTTVTMDFLYGARVRAARRRKPTSGCCSMRCAAMPRCSRARTRSSTPGASSPRSTQGWASLPPPQFPNYYPFTDGPDEANRLLEGTQARWRSLAEM